MAISLAALRITIGLKPNGHADYPDWGVLPSIDAASEETKAAGMNAACPFKWMYDKKSGHQEEDGTSPLGQQFGVLLCSQQFATEAIANLPAQYAPTQLTEVELQNFWDNRAFAHLDDEEVDVELLRRGKFQIEIIDLCLADKNLPPDPDVNRTWLENRRTTICVRLKNILDPTDETRGVKSNPRKTWAAFKVKYAITFLEP